IDDSEPKFGMSVTGRVDPRRLWKNSGARTGDVMVLTKPIGTGVITTAMKRGAADSETASRAIGVMTMLNGPAARVLAGFDVGAVTDVTGFGLMGHLREMSRGSGMDMELIASTVPLIPGALALVREGMVSGGSKANEELVGDVADWAPSLPADRKTLLCDAQTSGGLLASVAAGQADALVKALREGGCAEAAIVGRVLARGPGRITVL
ncbi:MAG: selenide, water dikinase SelD, partial [Spirochaetota bacterium]